MISAFDAIEVAGDISPSLVAGGIKQALLTTVFGLIVAIILQIFYNYIVSKIDDIVNDMEDSQLPFRFNSKLQKNKLKIINMIKVALYFTFGLFSVACVLATFVNFISY